MLADKLGPFGQTRERISSRAAELRSFNLKLTIQSLPRRVNPRALFVLLSTERPSPSCPDLPQVAGRPAACSAGPLTSSWQSCII